MQLSTQGYIVNDTPALPQAEATWPEVRKGLHGILLGYLLLVLSVVVGGAIIGLLVWQAVAETERPPISPGELEALAYIGGAGVFFALFGGYGMIVRGLWRCLMGAPERAGAKWLMFASILCALIGPALNFVAGFAMGSEEARPKSRRERQAQIMGRGVQSYAPGLGARDPAGYMQVAAGITSNLSALFFVLFLRAVARCFDDIGRVRMTELNVLYSLVLTGATVLLTLKPDLIVSHPEFLGPLVGGWVLGGLWHLFQLASISACISDGLERRKAAML